MHKPIVLSLSTLVLAAAGAASAQPAPKFEYGKADEVKDVKKPEWKAQAEAGAVLTTGNAETTTVTAGAKASRKAGNNKFELSASAAYARSGTRIAVDQNGNGMISQAEVSTDAKVTAETYEGKARYDRFFSTSNSLFVAALAKRDVPAGKELVFGGQLGYARQLYKSEKHEASGEFGYDYSYENQVGDADPLNIHSARAFVGHKGALSEETAVDSSVEVLVNLNSPSDTIGVAEDTRVNAAAGITSKLGSDLSFNFKLELKYDHAPAPLAPFALPFEAGFAPESSSLDTIFKASLIYSFF